MNLSLDGYIATPGDDLALEGAEQRAVPVVVRSGGATGLALYGRKLRATISSRLAGRRPAAWRHIGADRVRPPLAGPAEGGVLLDDQRGRLERAPGHRRRGQRDRPAQD